MAANAQNLISEVGTLVAAIAAAISAFFSWRSIVASKQASETARRAALAGFVVEWNSRYGEPEMAQAMAAVSRFREVRGASFAEDYAAEFSNERRTSEFDLLHSQFRKTRAHFASLSDLVAVGALSECEARSLLSPSQSAFIRDSLVPIGERLPTPDTVYERLNKLTSAR